MGGLKTDSTPTSPPSHTIPDIKGLCDLKKKILSNLPDKCAHCGKPHKHSLGSYKERDNDEIIAYCKTKDGCGRSQILFAALDLSYPEYKQICIFEDDGKLKEKKEEGEGQ